VSRKKDHPYGELVSEGACKKLPYLARRRTAPLLPPMEKLTATGIRGIRNETTDGLTASEAPRPQGKIPGHASGEQNVSKGNFILIVPSPACG